MNRAFAFALLIGSAAHAQEALTDIPAQKPTSAYVQDARGVVVRSGSGMCWRAGTWSQGDSVPGCDGPLVPPVASPIAPPLATATPAPAAAPAATPKPARCDFSYSLGGDQAFAFGGSRLLPAGRRALERELMPRLAQCAAVESVLITGHTDRLGAAHSNQKLSERRAAEVQNYLKAKGLAAQIEVLGAGSTAEVEACNERLPARKLRECLAPNRRVVIDVRGSAN